MHCKLLFLFLLFLFLNLASGKPQRNTRETVCEVQEDRFDGDIKPCQFPFIYKDVKYFGCTTIDGEGTPWCSTKVDPNTLEHDLSDYNFGNCDENVPACFNDPPDKRGNVPEMELDQPNPAFKDTVSKLRYMRNIPHLIKYCFNKYFIHIFSEIRIMETKRNTI